MGQGDAGALRRGWRALREVPLGSLRPRAPGAGIAGTCVVIMLVFTLYAHRWMETRRDAHREAVALLAGVRALPSGGQAPVSAAADASPPLIAVVNRSAAGHGLAFGDFRPDGDARLRLDLRAGDFDALLRWLALLEREHRVRVASLDARPTDVSGRVDAMLVLEREGAVQ